METIRVDVFTRAGAGGNPLTVVVTGDELPEAERTGLADDADTAETAFVSHASGGGPLRLHVHGDRGPIPFSGHAALGAAWAVRRQLGPPPPDRLELAVALGDCPVRFDGPGDGDTVWLTAPTIELGSTWPAVAVRRVLGLRGPAPEGLPPPQLTGIGWPVLIVPVPDVEALRTCVLNGPAFRSLAVRTARQKALHASVYAFCPQARAAPHQVAARLFVPGVDAEDPASGAAACCLGAYLHVHGRFEAPAGELCVEQGDEAGRPSLLRLRARPDGGSGLEVGGAVQVAGGAG